MSSRYSDRKDEVWITATMSFFHGDKKSIYQPFCAQCIFNSDISRLRLMATDLQ